ncbi:putative LRR receptor-like serine/threonine-protein kinase [Carex littledalei]|uniref:non-specific serine/threonine protein kinase n=1 Tax=Carex littledalei TaxID=544730 RepID=A0A833QST7_9POAL|nr:putative LRR receptor-like serine/threonine-protein kinase [Carex littledalei]
MFPLFSVLVSLFIISLSQSDSNLISVAAASEQQTLLNIKSKLSDPLSALASWRNDSINFCKWRGVTCDDSNPPHVTALDLTGLGLAGSLSPDIAHLTLIEKINLQNNSLCAEMPVELGRINGLKHLDLSYNQFYGLVPNSFYNISSLAYLNLYYNNLTGALPPNLGQRFPQIQILDVGFNHFDGDLINLITSLANCSALHTIDFFFNNLSGSLPNTIGNLSTKLQKLVLGYNNISGSIPREIGNLVNLTELDLSGNYFEGILPSTIGSLSNLGRMQISYNILSGPIPDSIGNLTKLYFLTLMENELNGTIPASLGNCTRLQILKICSNRLEGAMPRELFSLTSMIKLDASHNQLVGSIPDVSSMSSLNYLSLRGNNLTGTIPDSLGFCPSLEELFLGDNLIQGSIPETFKNMKEITSLGLSHNNLSGRIPEFFGTLHTLQYLNLAFNNLVGEVPTGGIFSNASAVSLLGNQGLCGGDSELHLPSCAFQVPEASKKSSKMVVIICAIITIAVLICFCLIVSILYKLRRNKRIAKLHTPVPFSKDKYKKVAYSDIAKATDGFSSNNLVGSGSFGSVYKGMLDNQAVAVKVFDLEQHGALRSFNSECESLRNIRHKNLVGVITLCSSLDFKGNEFKSLVFKYIPNGSLDEWIHPKSSGKKLSFSDGINIAMDVASGLSYLHHHCATPMVHCDIKPGNILIETDMTALVSDFGLARFLAASHSTSAEVSTTLVGLKGTIGYIPPGKLRNFKYHNFSNCNNFHTSHIIVVVFAIFTAEYALGSTISTQGDVYSFGIVLLEMLTGKRPTDAMFKDGSNIHAYVSSAFPEKIIEILDPSMFGEMNMDMEKCIIQLVHVGLACSKEAPKDRMRMEDVAAELSKIKQIYLGSI